jgi:MerR family transcriptional regulator, light-induced transcriptional regulator
VNTDLLCERLFECLINGDRDRSRAVVNNAIDQGMAPEAIVTDLFWPTYELVARLYRDDQLTRMAHHMATRLLRTLVDQMGGQFSFQPAIGKAILAFCGPTDADELAAQIACDLAEQRGFTVTFAGGDIAGDEILACVQDRQPDILLMFASAPTDLPEIRELIDQMREIGACSRTQIAVGGGVFNRAQGLAEEIGADIWATHPIELVETLIDFPDQRADANQRTVGRQKQVRKANQTRQAA